MLLFSVALVGIASLLAFALSPYSKSSLVIMSAFLIVSTMLFYGDFQLPKRSLLTERLFYVCITAIVIVEVVTNLGVVGAAYVSGAYDKNYFAIILFLYFCWCWSTGRKFGVATAVASAFLLGSRNYLTMLALFAVLTGVGMLHSRRAVEKGAGRDVWEEVLSPGAIFAIFAVMFIGIAAFSLWWSEFMVGVNTVSYADGLNDSSNAIRFNSNVFALNRIVENPQLLFYGYDDNIIDAMGIIQASSLDGTETALDGTFFNGYRIVQPHNIIFNMLLKEGALYTIGYFACLSFLFSKYFKIGNAAYWVPFLFGCMFMHSLMSTYYLVFFLLVLGRSKSGRAFVVRPMRDAVEDGRLEVEADVGQFSRMRWRVDPSEER